MNINPDFKLTSVSNKILTPSPIPLDLAASLQGKWTGTGFNQIWRPFHGTQDRFLELNQTIETLTFDDIPGEIPNRGLLQGDINLKGIRYLQQIQDAVVKGDDGNLAGIHVEPGLWLNIPSTTNPQDAPTVARLANIPHGTSIVTQGTATGPLLNTPPVFAPASITPFTIAPPHSPISFPETNLGVPSSFRTAPEDIPDVTQALVNNPNLFLEKGIAGKNIVSMIILKISTAPLNPPATGGGTSNIAFLTGAAGGPNAVAAQVDATFWIETIEEADGRVVLQLQYTQTVLLNFNGLSWPHVSVATLIKTP